jgi:hypothetical protein
MVGRRSALVLGADVAVRAAAVLDHERPAQRVRETVGEHRPAVSTPPPGGNGTMTRTDPFGYACCAAAGSASTNAQRRRNAERSISRP